MKNPPVEFVGAVVENISSTSDLLLLRSVNSACHQLVTPHVFHTLHILNSVQSAQNCRSILDSPSLAAHVREIVYDQRDHAHFSLPSIRAQGNGDDNMEIADLEESLTETFCSLCGFLILSTGNGDDNMEIADLEESLTETFCSLCGFNNLECVVLNFWPSFISQDGSEVREHPFWFTNRQITILHAVHFAIKESSEPSRIRSLTLNNIVLVPSASYDFVSSVTDSPLHHLSVSVVANSEFLIWSGSRTINGSLGSLLPLSNANLRSLILRSPQGLYHNLNTKLGGLCYPALACLVLENIIFDPVPSSEGIEEFIVRHKSSLHRLEIRSCPSYSRITTSPLRKWATIWKRLEEELTSLTEIAVNNAHQGYRLLDSIRGYIPHPLLSLSESTSTSLAREDEKAFLQFSDCVKRRSIRQ